MPRQHRLHYCLQSGYVRRDHFPEDSIIDTEVLVAHTVADSLYLSPRLRREIREPLVRDMTHCLRDGLDRVCSRPTHNWIAAEAFKRHACTAPVELRFPPDNPERRSSDPSASNNPDSLSLDFVLHQRMK